MKYFYKLFLCTLITNFIFSQTEPTCDWDFNFSASNATIAILQENYENIYLSGSDMSTSIIYIECPMWLGVFYQPFEGGPLECAGYVEFNNSQSIAIAAWGDDPTTPEKDGFLENEAYIFGLCIDGFGAFYNSAEMSTDPPFTDSYSTNAFGSVESINFGPPDLYVSDLISSCWGVSVDEYNNSKEVIRNIDLLGRDINSHNSSGFMLQFYSDFTFKKMYKL